MQTPNGYPYDPLATNFMAPGMQYMPRAQDLTDPSYGAFRTMPGYGGPAVMQQPTMWQSYLNMNEGRIPGMGFLGPYAANTYNPAIDQMKLQAMSARRFNSGIEAMKGAAGDFALGWGAQQAFGGASLLGFGANMLVSSFSPVSGAINDRIGAARKMQNMTMPLITFGQDASAMGQGFNMRAANSFDNGLRRMASSDLIFNEEDYRKMTKVGVESGMFDYANSSEQYKKILKNMRGNIKTLMEVWETADMKGLSEQMRRMQTMGASQDMFAGLSKQEAMFARMAGISHQDMVNTYGAQGAMIYSQMGLTGYQGSLENMANAGNNAIMQRLGLVTPGEVNRMGGIGGMAQTSTANKTKALMGIKDMVLPFVANSKFDDLNPALMEALKSGNFDYMTMMQQGPPRLNDPTAMEDYKKNSAGLLEKFIKDMGTDGMQAFLTRYAEQIGKTVNQGSGSREQDMFAGLHLMGMDDESAKLLVLMETSPEYKKAVKDGQLLQERKDQMNKEQAAQKESGWLNKLDRLARENMNEVGHKISKGPLKKFFKSQDEYEAALIGPISSTSAPYGAKQDRNAVTIESESGGRVDAIQNVTGAGGYGPIQLDSANHQKFFDTVGAEWASNFNGLTVDSQRYREKFAEVLRDDPRFVEATKEFNQKYNVDPMVSKLRSRGLDVDGRGIGFDSMVTSVATQLGPGLGATAMERALGNGKWDGKDNLKAYDLVTAELSKTEEYWQSGLRDGKYSHSANIERRSRELSRFRALEMNKDLDSSGFDPRTVQFADDTDRFIYNVTNSTQASKSVMASAEVILSKYNISEATLSRVVREEITSSGDVNIGTLKTIISRALQIDNPGMGSSAIARAIIELSTNTSLQSYIGRLALELNGDAFSLQMGATNRQAATKRKLLPSANEKEWNNLDADLESFAPRMKIIGSALTQTDSGAIDYLQKSMKGNKHSMAVMEFAKYCILYGTQRDSRELINNEAWALARKLGLSGEECARCLSRGKIPIEIKKKISVMTGLSMEEVNRLAEMGATAAENNPLAVNNIVGGASRVAKMEDRRDGIIREDIKSGISSVLAQAGVNLKDLKSAEDIETALKVVGDSNPQASKLLKQALQIANDHRNEDKHRGLDISGRLVDRNKASLELGKLGAADAQHKAIEAAKTAETAKANALTDNTQKLAASTVALDKLREVMDPSSKPRDAKPPEKGSSPSSVPGTYDYRSQTHGRG